MMNQKAIFSSIVLFFFFIISCKKKTDEPVQTTSTPAVITVVGTWSWTAAYTPDASNNYTVPLNPTGNPVGKTLDLLANNTYTANWSYADMGWPGATNPDNGNYNKSADSLILTSIVSGKTVRAKIYKLTSNELWVRYIGNQNYELHFTK
jgi:hypothetical protein